MPSFMPRALFIQDDHKVFIFCISGNLCIYVVTFGDIIIRKYSECRSELQQSKAV